MGDRGNGAVPRPGSVQENDVVVAFKSFLLEKCVDTMVSILSEKDDSGHFSLPFSVLDLLDLYPSIGSLFINYAEFSITLFLQAVREAQKTCHDSRAFSAAGRRRPSASADSDKRHVSGEHSSIKTNVHLRPQSLPVCASVTRTSLPRSIDAGKLISFKGRCVRAGGTKVLESRVIVQCVKCSLEVEISADPSQRFKLQMPTFCPGKKCRSNRFQVRNAVATTDYQVRIVRLGRDSLTIFKEIRVQEHTGRLALGAVPRSMVVQLEDDLVDTCSAGDDVVVIATVRRSWLSLRPSCRCDVELVLHALDVVRPELENAEQDPQAENEYVNFWSRFVGQPLLGRDVILKSICPQLYGLSRVKLALALVLVGGLEGEDDHGMRTRGKIHLLLVGDAGTGKSQLLKYVCQLWPRAILTTGVGTTTAGLTSAAIRDSGEWMLEAGALVLADGGVCCIDEFAMIREKDRPAVHESMEQGTLSVAKAGIVCSLNAAASVVAATCPKGGEYDPDQSMVVNSGVAGPLLSRFDVVLLLLDDERGSEWDRDLAKFVLSGYHHRHDGGGTRFSMDQLRSYLSFVKTLRPSLSQQASQVLTAFFTQLRSAAADGQAPAATARTTIRSLESMVRLSQAHARLMMRNVVTVQDAVVAISLVQQTEMSARLDFPRDPDSEYRREEQRLLLGLGLGMLSSVERIEFPKVHAPPPGGRHAHIMFRQNEDQVPAEMGPLRHDQRDVDSHSSDFSQAPRTEKNSDT